MDTLSAGQYWLVIRYRVVDSVIVSLGAMLRALQILDAYYDHAAVKLVVTYHQLIGTGYKPLT